MIARDRFFFTGGTLPSNSPSYVCRLADAEILKALLDGQLVYVLDSRQKGKSSLIVRTVEALQDRGVRSVRIDFQRLGNNLTPEQWYGGLLHSVGQDLELTSVLFSYWKEHQSVGPAMRFFSALEELVLTLAPGPLVLFVDEVDFCLSLPFAVDEFFAGVRQLFNRRIDGLSRITFCLSGVASPIQLIRNQEVTPFNVGLKIELTDFSRAELEPFVQALSDTGRNGNRLLDRIYYWTAGHPYLTQLLASHVHRAVGVVTGKDVDRLVHEKFLRSEGMQNEANLVDAERRILEVTLQGSSKEESRNRILDLYRILLLGRNVTARPEEPLVMALLLSGVATAEDGRLRIRNNLYRTIFDERWRRANLPDAERQRQFQASIRAAAKVGSVSFVLLGAVSFAAVWFLILSQERDRALAQSRRLASENSKIAYQTSIALASEMVYEGSRRKALDLLKSQCDYSEHGWEWGYLRSILNEPTEIHAPRSTDPAFASSRCWPDSGGVAETRGSTLYYEGKPVASASNADAMDRLSGWLRMTRDQAPLLDRVRYALPLIDQSSSGVLAISKDRKRMARVLKGARSIEVLLNSGRTKLVVFAPESPASLGFSESGRFLSIQSENSAQTYDIERRMWMPNAFWPNQNDTLILVPSRSGEASIRRVKDNSLVSALSGKLSMVGEAIWLTDQKRLVTLGNDCSVQVWRVSDGKQLAFYAADVPGNSITLATDERTILYATTQGGILSWPVDHTSAANQFCSETDEIGSVTVSPDGRRAVTNSRNGITRITDLREYSTVAAIRTGTFREALPTVFAPDGSILLMLTAEGGLLFVNPSDGRLLRKINVPGAHGYQAVISRSGKIVIVLREGGAITLDNWKSEPHRVESAKTWVRVAVSKDGSRFAFASATGEVQIFDARMKAIWSHRYSNNYITSIEFSPDLRFLSVSSRDFKAYLIDLDHKFAVKSLIGHFARVWQARFSPDSKMVLTTSYDGTAKVWDVRSGREISSLQHDSWVGAAEWSPDSRRVVTGCADRSVRLFDPLNGFELIKLREHRKAVLDVLFSPDGKSFLSASADGTGRIWTSQSSTMANTSNTD